MATAADSYRRHVSLEELFPISTFRFIVCNNLEPGYKDIVHFDRVFKKETGVTPLEYRSMNFINNITGN